MYTRELKEAPEYPVFRKEPAFGSYLGSFKFLDISGMRRPYGGFPIPSAVTKLRIFGSASFFFCDGDILGETFFFSNPVFAYMETVVWNRKTAVRHVYRQPVLNRLTRMPRKIEGGSISCRKKRNFARLSIRENLHNFALALKLTGTRGAKNRHQDLSGKLVLSCAAAGGAVFSALVPYVNRRRCQASIYAAGYAGGEISCSGKTQRFQGAALAELREAYFSLRTKAARLYGFSVWNGKVLAFCLGDSVSKDDYACNSNVLLYDGKITPLPPVRITRPYGSAGEWIIQDTENMVDLKFLPVSVYAHKKSLLIVRTQYKTVYGNFEGALMTADGEMLPLKDFPGIAKKILLRL